MADLRQIFEEKYNRANWQVILKEYFGAKTIHEKPLTIEVKNNQYHGVSAVEIGSFETDKELLMGIYEIDLPSNVNLSRNKKTVRDLLSSIYKNDVDGALVVFNQESTNKWRFSYVTEMKQNATHWKRYTYLLGEGERCKTAADRFEKIGSITKDGKAISIDDLNDAFSVEQMSKEFFDTYREHYGRFTTYLTGEDENGEKAGSGRTMSGFATFFPGETKLAKKNARDFVKKMMGRIVFLYFLEKKGWLGVKEGSDWGDGDELFMSHLIQHAKNPEIFYSEVLVPLFFDTLNNSERRGDFFKIKSSVFKEGDYSKLRIPYLNGGLFAEEDKALKYLVFPKELFYNTEAETEDDFGLFQFLDLYNFTVDEDSKRDHTVAVDPEMMGHIFENLLEDNKEKGTFYTPKAVVEYMCQESLLEYLSTKLNADENLKVKLDLLIRTVDKGMEECRDHMPEIVKALKDVKICDPAIGSGAFPMGMLMEIYHLMEKLEVYSIARNAWPIESWEKDSHKIKLHIIENNIYGVDIEKGAVDIARLRFWLSLIVDLDKPEALPNLDYRIVQGNSLLNELHVNSKYTINVDIDWNIESKGSVASTKKLMEQISSDLEELISLQKDYFNPKADKKALEIKIRDLKISILINQIELDKLAYSNSAKGVQQTSLLIEEDIVQTEERNPKSDKELNESRKLKLEEFSEALKYLKELKKSPKKPLVFFNFALDFADILNPQITENCGFDIVIGNPPYVNVEKVDKSVKEQISKFKTAYKKYDLYVLFYEVALNLTKKNGSISFITSNKFLSQSYGLILRQELLKREINTIVNFNYDVFENATVRTVILNIKNRAPEQEKYIKIIDVESEKDKDKFKMLQYNYLKQNTFSDTEENNFRINLTDEKLALLDVIKVNTIKIEEICSVNYGLRPVNLNPNKDKYSFIKESFSKGLKKYFEGKDTGIWLIKQHSFIEYKVKEMYNPMFKELFEAEKLAGLCTLSEINKLRFIYDDKGYYCNHSMGILVLWHLFEGIDNSTIRKNISEKRIEMSRNFEYKYLQAILNSKLIKFYVNELLYDGTHFYPNHMKSLPIKVANAKQQNAITEIVNKIHDKLKHDAGVNVTKYVEKLDLLIYRLYNLEYDRVKLIDPEFELAKELYENVNI